MYIDGLFYYLHLRLLAPLSCYSYIYTFICFQLVQDPQFVVTSGSEKSGRSCSVVPVVAQEETYPYLYRTNSVEICVIDTNDHAPKFTQGLYIVKGML